MLTAWRASVAALRAPLVAGACIGCFALGVLTAPPSDRDTPPPTRAAAITDESVNRLAAALEAVQSTTTPPEAATTVDQAEEVLDSVRAGEVTVVVTPATVAPVQPTLPVTTTVATTTPTATTTTTADDEVLRWVAP